LVRDLIATEADYPRVKSKDKQNIGFVVRFSTYEERFGARLCAHSFLITLSRDRSALGTADIENRPHKLILRVKAFAQPVPGGPKSKIKNAYSTAEFHNIGVFVSVTERSSCFFETP
jgi:hypothetical protein